MIVKILSSSANFNGVNYNTSKIDRNQGELMKVANFGPLQGLGRLRPQDYINYLKMLSAQNKRVKSPQFHAVISARGKTYDKSALTKIAEAWLKEMDYGEQPYLIVFHKDTDNNHVHIVSTRIDRNGKKISSAFEHVRAIQNINKVLGIDMALRYQFSTKAQFLMILENGGYLGRDVDEQLLEKHIDKYQPDKNRAVELKRILQQHGNNPELLKKQYGIDLIFHSSEGKKAYGYSLIDHEQKRVFKGSEVWPLKELLAFMENPETGGQPKTFEEQAGEENPARDRQQEIIITPVPCPAVVEQPAGSKIYIPPIRIADDVDDQQIHGPRRRRQKKARTNTR